MKKGTKRTEASKEQQSISMRHVWAEKKARKAAETAGKQEVAKEATPKLFWEIWKR